MPIDPLLLEGRWMFDRTIDDRFAGEQSRVTGTTEFASEPDGRIRWSETGVMEWQGKRLPVSRTLFIEPRETGWFVTFHDGRDFHPWATDEEVEHPCGADFYRGLIEPSPSGPWHITWSVSGPAKDYTMVTALSVANDR